MLDKYIYKINTLDYDELLNFLKNCNSEFTPKLSERISLDEYAKKILNFATTFEAWDGNEFVATVIAYINDFETKQAFVTLAYCKKQHRRKGIISCLIKMLEAKCKEKDFTSITLNCSVDNEKAISMYEKNNFEIFGNKNKEKIIFKKRLSK